MRYLIALLIFCTLLLTSCSRQHNITGEPLLYGLSPTSGKILDRDTPDYENKNLVTPHKGEIITLVLNNIFIKYLKDVSSPHVLVYAQVFDDGTDNPETAITKVLYNERNSPEGVNLGLSDRVIYGPTPFKGFPLRVKLFIVELDKEQKELASKIIDSVGSVTSAANPEVAPAIEIAVSIAKAINEMNEDDFELRFDMTLYPVGFIGKAITDDPDLDEVKEPSQRFNRYVTLVTPLRTGLYTVMKRELKKRFDSRYSESVPEISVFDMDYSQEYFTSSYIGADGQIYLADEILRYQGGYLQRITKSITNAQTGEEVDSMTVILRSGPNKGIPFSLTKGIRQRFTDRTYVMLSVVPGLPVGLDYKTLSAVSARDSRQLAKLLDNPSDASLSERIGPKIDEIAASIKTMLEQRRISEHAARHVGRDPSFRTSTDYVIFWAGQIDPLSDDPNTIKRRNAEAKNLGIVEVLNEIVINLPILDATNPGQMASLEKIKKLDLEKIENIAGVFKLTETGIKKINGE